MAGVPGLVRGHGCLWETERCRLGPERVMGKPLPSPHTTTQGEGWPRTSQPPCAYLALAPARCSEQAHPKVPGTALVSGPLRAHLLVYLWCRRTALGLPARRQPAWGEQEHRQVMEGMSALVPGASGNAEQQAAPQHAHPTHCFCLGLPSVPGDHHARWAYLVPRNRSQGSSHCSGFVNCCWAEMCHVFPERLCSQRRRHFSFL